MESENNPTNAAENGGTGGEVEVLPRKSIQDIRMKARALKEGWAIPPAAFQALPNEMLKIAIGKTLKDGQEVPLVDSNGKPVSSRTRIAAARVVALMHGQNQNDEPQEVNVNLGLSEPERTARVAELLNAARVRRIGQPASPNGNGTVPETNGSGK